MPLLISVSHLIYLTLDMLNFFSLFKVVTPSLLYNGYQVFPRGKAAGVWH
jgi:hypothetical protein